MAPSGCENSSSHHKTDVRTHGRAECAVVSILRIHAADRAVAGLEPPRWLVRPGSGGAKDLVYWRVLVVPRLVLLCYQASDEFEGSVILYGAVVRDVSWC
jgi:hypothetical protein